MKIIVHRGIDQIGGCITEIATNQARIIIDLGLNLPKGSEPSEDVLNSHEAINDLCNGVDAIFYTHYHSDHVGLFKHVPKGTKQYIGEISKDIIRVGLEARKSLRWLKKECKASLDILSRFKCYQANKPIVIGDIRITPYFVSHSAADTHMFLIEADGKRILHTGDFRKHGYLGGKLIPMLEKYIVPAGVDILITEGTMLDRMGTPILHENEIQKGLKAVMQQYKNVFVYCSSTDIDRLASVHAANKSMIHRPMICDKYQKKVFDIVTATMGTKAPLYQLNYKIYNYRESNRKLSKWMHEEGFTILVRNNKSFEKMCMEIVETYGAEQSILVYSMFKGYIDPEHEAYNPKLDAFVKLFPRHVQIHTSGHASREALEEVCNLLSPRQGIIPIHKEAEANYASLNIGDELRGRIITASTVLDGVEIEIKG